MGRVKSSYEKDNFAYGPIIFYHVVFDDGDEARHIPDQFVLSEEDYNFNLEKSTSEWIGVENHTGKRSRDKWASIVGWYVVLIDKKKYSFSFLADAIRLYELNTVRHKGIKTKKEDLNLPHEWKIDGELMPTHILLKPPVIKIHEMPVPTMNPKEALKLAKLLSLQTLDKEHDLHNESNHSYLCNFYIPSATLQNNCNLCYIAVAFQFIVNSLLVGMIYQLKPIESQETWFAEFIKILDHLVNYPQKMLDAKENIDRFL